MLHMKRNNQCSETRSGPAIKPVILYVIWFGFPKKNCYLIFFINSAKKSLKPGTQLLVKPIDDPLCNKI